MVLKNRNLAVLAVMSTHNISPSFLIFIIFLFPLQILFWGVREMKRLQLMTVDKPRCDVEVGGVTMQSAIILNANKNPNFADNIRFIDVVC